MFPNLMDFTEKVSYFFDNEHISYFLPDYNVSRLEDSSQRATYGMKDWFYTDFHRFLLPKVSQDIFRDYTLPFLVSH